MAPLVLNANWSEKPVPPPPPICAKLWTPFNKQRCVMCIVFGSYVNIIFGKIKNVGVLKRLQTQSEYNKIPSYLCRNCHPCSNSLAEHPASRQHFQRSTSIQSPECISWLTRNRSQHHRDQACGLDSSRTSGNMCNMRLLPWSQPL
jgi:hypothetical protein